MGREQRRAPHRGLAARTQGEEEEGDEESAPGPVTVLAIAAAAHGEVAVALQGYSDVLLLRVIEGGTALQVTGRLTCAAPTAVSSVTYDAAGQLCAAGMAVAEEEAEAAAAVVAPLALVMLPAALTEKLTDAAAAGLSVGALAAVEGAGATALHFSSTEAMGLVMPLKGLVKRKHTQAERDAYKVRASLVHGCAGGSPPAPVGCSAPWDAHAHVYAYSLSTS
jgi:hypothetical protein